MPKTKSTNPDSPSRQLLAERALQRLKLLQPTAGQITPHPEEEDWTIGINKPTDPHGYGPAIWISNGKLDHHTPKEIIQEYGLDFFNKEIKPLLRR